MFSPALLAFHNLGSHTRSVLLKKSFWEQFWQQNEAGGTGSSHTPLLPVLDTPAMGTLVTVVGAVQSHRHTQRPLVLSPDGHNGWSQEPGASSGSPRGYRGLQPCLGLDTWTMTCSRQPRLTPGSTSSAGLRSLPRSPRLCLLQTVSCWSCAAVDRAAVNSACRCSVLDPKITACLVL